MNKVIKLYDNPEAHLPFSNKDGHLKWHGVHAKSRREAFEISINKWQIIVNGNPPVRIEGSFNTCGLCHLYFWEENCGTCPVAEAGYISCEGSPYDDWHRSESREAAQAELDFLIDLARKEGFEIKEVHDDEENH